MDQTLKVFRNIVFILDVAEGQYGAYGAEIYGERWQTLYKPRYRGQYLNELIGAKAVRQSPQMHLSGSDTSHFLLLAIASPSLSILFRFEDESRFQMHLAYEEVEVKIRALRVDFKVKVVAPGQLASNILEYECARIVSSTQQQG